MRKIRKFFIDNRNTIIKVAGITIILIVLIQVMNQIALKGVENEEEIPTLEETDYGQKEEIISGNIKNDSDYNKEKNIMQQFSDYCNNKNYQEAYEILTDNCKSALFPTLELFKTNYVDIYFPNKKTCSFQSWNNKTYMVEIRDDLMTTGKYEEDNYTEDYYTIHDSKLSIKGFIGRNYMSNKAEDSDIEISVQYIDYYMDYTDVKFNVKNKNNEKVLLDTQENNTQTILVDKKNIGYSSKIKEISKEELMIPAHSQKNVTIRYDLSYRSTLNLTNIKFKNIIVDYDYYIENPDFMPKTAEIDINI